MKKRIFFVVLTLGIINMSLCNACCKRIRILKTDIFNARLIPIDIYDNDDCIIDKTKTKGRVYITDDYVTNNETFCRFLKYISSYNISEQDSIKHNENYYTVTIFNGDNIDISFKIKGDIELHDFFNSMIKITPNVEINSRLIERISGIDESFIIRLKHDSSQIYMDK